MILDGHYEGPGGLSIQIVCRSRSFGTNSRMSEHAPDVKAFLDVEARRVQEALADVIGDPVEET